MAVDTAPANRHESQLVQQMFDFMLPVETPERIVGDKATTAIPWTRSWPRMASS